jgi:hypothetical protein
MTSRRREDRPSSWEEIVAGLWQALEQTRPVARELAEKRAELSPLGDGPHPAPSPRAGSGADFGETQDEDGSPFPQADAPRVEEAPSLEPAARLLSRELLFGRVVLIVGVAALASALAFALHVVVSAPEPPATVGAPAPGPASGRGRPAPARPGAPAPPGRLLVALVPEGFLEEVTGLSGHHVAGPEPLPASLTLPAGSYRAVLSHAAGGCAITVSFEIRSGKTTRVLESCLDPD